MPLDRALPQPNPLPDNLPRPTDDGAARHLPGQMLPALTLPTTAGSLQRLDRIADGRWVLFIYPSTGKPGDDIPAGWNDIPGARGCSNEACSFRDNLGALEHLGIEHVRALSSDPIEYQQALVRRFHLPYLMLSDSELSLAAALKVPTFQAHSKILYKRLTMVIRGSTIEHCFYPIFPPDSHAAEVVDWLTANPLTGA